MKDTARHSDYMLWVERCQVSGSNGQCGNRSVQWPAGDGGRCETIAADTVAAQTGMAPGMPPTAEAPDNAFMHTDEMIHAEEKAQNAQFREMLLTLCERTKSIWKSAECRAARSR